MTKKEKERFESKQEYYKNTDIKKLIEINNNFLNAFSERFGEFENIHKKMDNVTNSIDYENISNLDENEMELIRYLLIQNIIDLTDNMNIINKFQNKNIDIYTNIKYLEKYDIK